MTAAVAFVLWGIWPRDSGPGPAARARRELVHAVRDLRASGGDPARQTVLGIWEVGAHLLYYSDKPVVASGYHRNLDGIRDAYRFLASPSPELCDQILAARQVRWIVRQGDPAFFLQVGEAFPELGSLGKATPSGVQLDPVVPRTAWAALGGTLDPRSPLRLVYESPGLARWFGAFPGPPFHVSALRGS